MNPEEHFVGLWVAEEHRVSLWDPEKHFLGLWVTEEHRVSLCDPKNIL